VRWWKVLGLAGVVGVAASGAVVARAERRRKSYTADEVRDRLHARHQESIDDDPSTSTSSSADGEHTGR